MQQNTLESNNGEEIPEWVVENDDEDVECENFALF